VQYQANQEGMKWNRIMENKNQ